MNDPTAKLLLVDDNLNNLRILQVGFSTYPYELYTARDGVSALELAHLYQPDLILLDINMPGMGGFEVCTRLQASSETADIPVIFLSARDQPFDKIHGLEVGGVDYITKPFDFAEVSARVKVHLALRQHQQQILLRQQQDMEMLERLNEMKTEVLRRLKHDVQSPVTNILLSVDMLKRHNMVSDPRGLQILERISKSTQAITSLFSNVIDIAKSERMPELRYEKVMIGDFIEDVIAASISDAEQKDITISVSYEAVEPSYWAQFDLERMTSVFLNLLSNAIKYSPVGGEIKVGISQSNTGLVCKFADTGYGIRPEDLPRLFQKYFRGTQPNVDIAGTGLGLYIVKMLVEQHGGKVWVESEYGQGSTFYVSIPEVAVSASG